MAEEILKWSHGSYKCFTKTITKKLYFYEKITNFFFIPIFDIIGASYPYIANFSFLAKKAVNTLILRDYLNSAEL